MFPNGLLDSFSQRCALGLGGIASNKATAFLELLATTVLIVEQGTDNAVKAAFSGFLEGGPFHVVLAQYYDDALFLDLVKQKMSDPELAKTWVRGYQFSLCKVGVRGANERGSALRILRCAIAR